MATVKPIYGTIKLDDLRLFAAVAAEDSFAAACRKISVPKQTLSRRIASLEESLGVRLLQRTTRRMKLTDAGAAFAKRCQEIVTQTEDAIRSINDTQEKPKGCLRITADPVFGEAFLSEIIVEYAIRYPNVELDVVFTRRHVDLVSEGFDIAFRVSHSPCAGLTSRVVKSVGLEFCASPAYLAEHGVPSTPADLSKHSCILVVLEGTSMRWPFRSSPNGRGVDMISVTGRLRFTDLSMAHQAAHAGLGIAMFPEFVCAEDIKAGRLVPVLGDWRIKGAQVSVIYPTNQFLSPRVRRFLEIVDEKLVSMPVSE